MSSKYLFTSESVTEGHPDKVCDQVSDAFVDEYLKQDPNARTAIEVMVATDFAAVAGEVSSTVDLDHTYQDKVVRRIIQDIGYDTDGLGFDSRSCKVDLRLHPQSADIDMGVTPSNGKGQGAGDQGLMFGYATNETDQMMPMPISLAHKMTERMAQIRQDGTAGWMRPDGKSQVSVRYRDNKPVSIQTVVISTQHNPDVSNEKIRKTMIDEVIKPILGDMWGDHILVHVNPTGRFVIGGPHGDVGLTGRKIIVDTYGGMSRHGGGAFSGKDPSKVDRSASYMCRYVAKNIVAAGIAERCEIQVAYAIGVSEPISLLVQTFGTGIISDDTIRDIIREHFDLTPSGIIDTLNLKHPVYRRTSTYGHFGRAGFMWEDTDMADTLRDAART